MSTSNIDFTAETHVMVIHDPRTAAVRATAFDDDLVVVRANPDFLRRSSDEVVQRRIAVASGAALMHARVATARREMSSN